MSLSISAKPSAPGALCPPASESAHGPAFRRSAASARTREEMILAHVPQVRLIARGVWERTRFTVDLDDLIGYGMLGLLDAVNKFDPQRGFLLKTYAEHRIRGAILDGLRGLDWMTRTARKRAKTQTAAHTSTGNAAVRKCAEHQERDQPEFNGQTGRPERGIPSECTVLFHGGGVWEIERLYQQSISRAQGGSRQPAAERLLEKKQQRSSLAEAIAGLPERQRRVLELHYRGELSMKQIAALLEVHESRVSQIHLAAIARLRKSLAPATESRPGRLRSGGQHPAMTSGGPPPTMALAG